ncbi:MAG TPA: toxic anion resistance protein [Candidatus Limiplasma sp.]|nr:toxic anion resistance protein [Candidatus Limiplasma sp.]HPS80654.1 toxic anion resistance protein [Candidatus Limiplasma sp.]
MTEQNQTPETATATAAVPVLTLDTDSMAKDKADMDEAVAALEKAGVNPNAGDAAKAVEATLADMDTSMLSDAEKKSIDDFVGKIDIQNPDHVLLFGADAQKKVADFSDSALATVRTDQTGEVGNMLVKLVSEIKGFGSEADKPSGIKGIFWNAQKAIEEMKSKYDKVEVNVDNISTSLENYQVQLLKDVSMFNHLYDMNTQYFKELTMYIIAGGKKLDEVRSTTLQELKTKAQQSGDAMDAQRANDLAAACDRFEKKLYDLKLTRTVALQMAPQIRLLQSNDSLLVERIQSTLSNTLPLWKSQIVIALGMQRSQDALRAQTAVTDMTNELLKKNAEKLKMGTIETAREAERGIIDIETLTQTNQSLIDTITEVMKIQDDGRTKRVEAEKQLVVMETQLKQKLLELRH